MYYFLVNSLVFAKFVSIALLIVIQGSTVDCHSFILLFIYLFIFSTKYVTVSTAERRAPFER